MSVATYDSLNDALAHARRINGVVRSYCGVHRVHAAMSQPVQDGARSAAERRYDRALARADRLADFHDRELNAAVEQYLARTRESERGAHHGAPSNTSPPRGG